MEDKVFLTQDFTTAKEIKRIRKQLGLTQKEFAALVGSSKSTVERWETSTSPIEGPIVLLLKMLERYPEYLQEVKVPDRVYPLRLWYMHEQKVCSIIDVNEMSKQIKVTNYVDNPMFRAFGNVEEPDYNMYQEFLESRCFPKSRDKMKLVLADLALPFYDPFLIIERTEGRMAEDNFWIRIERYAHDRTV